MAPSKDYLEYILDQLSGLDDVYITLKASNSKSFMDISVLFFRRVFTCIDLIKTVGEPIP